VRYELIVYVLFRFISVFEVFILIGGFELLYSVRGICFRIFGATWYFDLRC